MQQTRNNCTKDLQNRKFQTTEHKAKQNQTVTGFLAFLYLIIEGRKDFVWGDFILHGRHGVPGLRYFLSSNLVLCTFITLLSIYFIYMQLFRERLSYRTEMRKSNKPKGIMSNSSSSLLYQNSEMFHQDVSPVLFPENSFIHIAPYRKSLLCGRSIVDSGFHLHSLIIYSFIQISVTVDDVQANRNLPCILWRRSQSEEEH